MNYKMDIANLYYLALLFVLLHNILLSPNNAYCKPTNTSSLPHSEKAKLNDGNSTTSDLPIDPLILLYISDHIGAQECFQLCTYLFTNSTPTMSLNRIPKVNQCPAIQPGREKEFPCYSSLKQWGLSLRSAKLTHIDERIYAETAIFVALHKIHRKDLHAWMKKVIKSEHHDEIQNFEKELDSYHSKGPKKLPRHIHSFEEEEAHSIEAISLIGLFFFIGLSAVAITYVCITTRLKPNNYIPLKSTNSYSNFHRENNRGHYKYTSLASV